MSQSNLFAFNRYCAKHVHKHTIGIEWHREVFWLSLPPSDSRNMEPKCLNAADLRWEGPILSCGNLLRKPFTPSRKPSGNSSFKAVYIIRAEDVNPQENASKHFHIFWILLIISDVIPLNFNIYQPYGYQVLPPLLPVGEAWKAMVLGRPHDSSSCDVGGVRRG